LSEEGKQCNMQSWLTTNLQSKKYIYSDNLVAYARPLADIDNGNEISGSEKLKIKLLMSSCQIVLFCFATSPCKCNLLIGARAYYYLRLYCMYTSCTHKSNNICVCMMCFCVYVCMCVSYLALRVYPWMAFRNSTQAYCRSLVSTLKPCPKNDKPTLIYR
jgi:hypothetical protein